MRNNFRIITFLYLLFCASRVFAIEAPSDLITHSQPQDGCVVLSWTPVPAAAEYRVYRGTALGAYSLAATTTRLSFIDDGFAEDATNYYVVRAYAGEESANSNAVSFTPQQLILSPQRIVVIVNDNVPDSVEVGEYYAQQRSVPSGNICHVTTVATETCSGAEYAALAAQVNSFLDSNGLRDSTYCLLTTFGIPLRRTDNNTAVDSNLATLRTGATANDYYNAGSTLPSRYDGSYSVYMVTRLDATNKNIAKGLVDKALAAEANADFYTSGIGVFDARRHPYNNSYTIGSLYAREAFTAARRIGLATYFDDDDGVIREGKVTDTVILYWGWYTHYYGGIDQRYGGAGTPPLTFDELEDPFTFSTGAVAIHLESETCGTIRNSNPDTWSAHQWVPWMVNYKGITATGGAVAEPFLSWYCRGDRFVETLTKGYTFAEAAYIATPTLNWMMCYVGDPLYVPFGKRLKNHCRVFGKLPAYQNTTAESRYNEIGEDAPDTTFFSTAFGIVNIHNYGAGTQHRYVLDYPKTFHAEGGPVPAGAEVVSARLLMRAHHNANDAGTLNFYRITDPDGKGAWKQSMADTAPNVGVSWAYRDASTGLAWDNASTGGGTYSAGDVIAHTAGMSWRKLLDVDVTAHVQAWASGAVNHGWVIGFPSSGHGDSFWGGDYTEAPVDAPLLEVFWNAGPVANAGADTVAMVGELLAFDGTGSYDPDFGPNALSYSWDFDASDGIQVDATGASPTHVFGAAGTYTVTLTVSDGKTQAQDTVSVNVSGTDVSPPLVNITHVVLAGDVSDDMNCPAELAINGSIAVPVSVAGLNGTWTTDAIAAAGGGTFTISGSDTNNNTQAVAVVVTE